MNRQLIVALAKVIGVNHVGVINYDDASRMLGKRDKKKLDNNTYLVKTNEGYGIKLHNTVVVEILPHNLFSLHTGGYYTNTTKDRINKFAPVSVYSEKGDWYFGRDKKTRTAFKDGMIIDDQGNVVG